MVEGEEVMEGGAEGGAVTSLAGQTPTPSRTTAPTKCRMSTTQRRWLHLWEAEATACRPFIPRQAVWSM
jgi:hypothetical protein